MDLWGPARTKSYGGASYLYTITDDATRYSWVFALERKSDTFGVFKDFIASVERISGFQIKSIRSDRGGVLFKKF
uniref:Integrase catalytic domain-containing protein n=1 Tax=Strigamia maritima TaxID=126957 RepID=T1JMI6_STRMM